MPSATPASWTDLFTAARRVLYPFLQILCYGTMTLAFFALVFVSIVSQTTEPLSDTSDAIRLFSLNALAGGLPVFAIMFGMAGLLFFRFWEKILAMVLILALAWLVKPYLG